MNHPNNILFLCTANSARSILGEALATTLSHGRFIGYSAGSKPKKSVHPIVLKLAREMGYRLNSLEAIVGMSSAGRIHPTWISSSLFAIQLPVKSVLTGLDILQLRIGDLWTQLRYPAVSGFCAMPLDK